MAGKNHVIIGTAGHVDPVSYTHLGGGALPEEELPSVCVSLCPRSMSAQELSRRLRLARTPVIVRIEDGCVLLDMRTVFMEEISLICDVFHQVFLN